MSKLARIICGSDSVSEIDANTVFKVLIPIVETDPRSEYAVDAARDVIDRCALKDDRPLVHVIDWWFVATTGKPSVNGGAHQLPESLDHTVRHLMEEVVRLGVKLPASEWLEKRRRFEAQLGDLDTIFEISHAKHPSEQAVWTSLCEQLKEPVEALRNNRRAQKPSIDGRHLEQKLKNLVKGVGSGRSKGMRKRFRETVRRLEVLTDLQQEVEPWHKRPIPTVIEEIPDQFYFAVGSLSPHLLRPLLAAKSAPAVDRAKVATELDDAGRRGTLDSRYKLAKIVSSWCEQTGQQIASLDDLIVRHRAVLTGLDELDAKGNLSSDAVVDVKFHILDDDIEEAEQALQRLRKQARRRRDQQLARSQYEGLRRKLRESTLSGDAGWLARLEGVESRLSTDDPSVLRSQIGAAQRELSQQLDALIRESQQDLSVSVATLRVLAAPDSLVRHWEHEITELERRGGRRAGELKFGIEEAVRNVRRKRRDEMATDLAAVGSILADEASDFAQDDLRNFASLHSELQSLLAEIDRRLPGLADATHGDAEGVRVEHPGAEFGDGDLTDGRERAAGLLRAVEDRRIHRWTPDQGEQALIDHLVHCCKGLLDFDSQDIRRLHVSLKTRPFVILAGLTGSGKSTLSRLYAEALGANSKNGRFRRIAVRPDWIDQSEVLGFVNPITEQFIPGWLAETVRDCERHDDRLHFVLLDEMNLAPVEQYLAEWLSAIEEARSRAQDVTLPLYSRSVSPKNADEWPSSLPFPKNLIIIGTVNVDETTRPLSERVIDRANVLLLSVEVSNRHHEVGAEPPAPWHVGLTEWREVCAGSPSDAHHEFLVDVANILRQSNIGVGLRAHLELERFVANANGILKDEEALDWGLVQRIIPKIRGYKRSLEPMLEELQSEFKGVGALQACVIMQHWLDDQVSDDEFLDGTDPRLALARLQSVR